ncbi:Hermansky-Pudlak syndrome 4 protein isoform X2 [Protopterus annectens]|uniref:Hermansky-Pudlak syndrome 4 protein isoform X2 n=1 Tax=Protopterus annectens TaxID=7888 RepID=UPI001CFAE769|nr:Hermansky-Pudlak syndrome 4 protein isoform X2 [Protopterus annectens]
MASATKSEPKPASWCSYFFLYDTSKVREEGDLTREGICYFYPPQTALDQQELLCGQIAGVARCVTEISASPPTLIRMRKLKFAIKAENHYIWALGCIIEVPDRSCLHFLDQLIGLFEFYNGQVRHAYQACSQDSLGSEWDLYVEHIQRNTNELHMIFNSLWAVDRTKVEPLLLLKAALILQTCQRCPYVLGGCILYGGQIVSTQLPPQLTAKVLFQNSRSNPESASEGEDETPDQDPSNLPQNVSIISVFLTEEEATLLRCYPVEWMSGLPISPLSKTFERKSVRLSRTLSDISTSTDATKMSRQEANEKEQLCNAVAGERTSSLDPASHFGTQYLSKDFQNKILEQHSGNVLSTSDKECQPCFSSPVLSSSVHVCSEPSSFQTKISSPVSVSAPGGISCKANEYASHTVVHNVLESDISNVNINELKLYDVADYTDQHRSRDQTSLANCSSNHLDDTSFLADFGCAQKAEHGEMPLGSNDLNCSQCLTLPQETDAVVDGIIELGKQNIEQKTDGTWSLCSERTLNVQEVIGSYSSVEQDDGNEWPTASGSIPSEQNHDSRSSNSGEKFVKMKLYVHRVKRLALLLLAEEGFENNRSSIEDVHYSSLASLNGLEVHLKETLPKEQSTAKITYYFTHYDCIQNMLQTNLPEYHCTQDQQFMRAVNLVHSDFNNFTTLHEMIVRNATTAVYACQNSAQETYFQHLQTPIRNSGLPNQQDSAFSLPGKAKQKLLKHGVNLL